MAVVVNRGRIDGGVAREVGGKEVWGEGQGGTAFQEGGKRMDAFRKVSRDET